MAPAWFALFVGLMLAPTLPEPASWDGFLYGRAIGDRIGRETCVLQRETEALACGALGRQTDKLRTSTLRSFLARNAGRPKVDELIDTGVALRWRWLVVDKMTIHAALDPGNNWEKFHQVFHAKRRLTVSAIGWDELHRQAWLYLASQSASGGMGECLLYELVDGKGLRLMESQLVWKN